MREICSVPEQLAPSFLEHFWQTRERRKVVSWTQKTRAGGQSTPALVAATLSGCLSSVYLVKDGFGLLEIAVAGVILLDCESLEVCFGFSVA